MKSLPNEIFSIRLVMAIAVPHSYLINKCHSRAIGNETLLLHVKEPWATYCEWRWKRKLMTKRKLKKKIHFIYFKEIPTGFFVGVFRIIERSDKSSISVRMGLSLLFENAASPKTDWKKATTFKKRLAKATSGRQGEIWHSSLCIVQRRRCFWKFSRIRSKLWHIVLHGY